MGLYTLTVDKFSEIIPIWAVLTEMLWHSEGYINKSLTLWTDQKKMADKQARMNKKSSQQQQFLMSQVHPFISLAVQFKNVWAPQTLEMQRNPPLRFQHEQCGTKGSDMAWFFKISVMHGKWCSAFRCRPHRNMVNKLKKYSWGKKLTNAIKFYAENIVEAQLMWEMLHPTEGDGMDVYMESLQELQRCDRWINEIKKVQSLDVFVSACVGALTGLPPNKNEIDSGFMAFVYASHQTIPQIHELWCCDFPDWDGVKRHGGNYPF